MPRILPLVPVVVVTLVGAVARFHGLGRQPLWFDESLTLYLARLPLGEFFRQVVIWEQLPPLGHLVVRAAIALFGTSEWALRLPSAVASTAAVAVGYLLVRRLGTSVASATGAGLALAVAPYQVLYAQEARPYALLVLFSLMSTHAFARLLEGARGRRDVGYYVVSTALALWAHPMAPLVPACHVVARGVLRDAALPWRRLVGALVVAALLFAPWLPSMYEAAHNPSSQHFWVTQFSGDDVALSYWCYVGPVAALLLVIGLAVVGVRVLPRRAAVVLGLLATVPVAVPGVVSMTVRPLFTPRYGIAAGASLVLMAGAAAGTLRPRGVAWVAVAIMAVALVVPVGEPPESVAWMPVKGHAKESGAYLHAAMRAGDVAAYTPRFGKILFDYYVDRPDVASVGFNELPVPVRRPLARGSHLWLALPSPSPFVRAILTGGGWRVVSHKGFPDVLFLELAEPDEGGPAGTAP